jgi:hypothetical protein
VLVPAASPPAAATALIVTPVVADIALIRLELRTTFRCGRKLAAAALAAEAGSSSTPPLTGDTRSILTLPAAPPGTVTSLTGTILAPGRMGRPDRTSVAGPPPPPVRVVTMLATVCVAAMPGIRLRVVVPP